MLTTSQDNYFLFTTHFYFKRFADTLLLRTKYLQPFIEKYSLLNS